MIERNYDRVTLFDKVVLLNTRRGTYMVPECKGGVRHRYQVLSEERLVRAKPLFFPAVYYIRHPPMLMMHSNRHPLDSSCLSSRQNCTETTKWTLVDLGRALACWMLHSRFPMCSQTSAPVSDSAKTVHDPKLTDPSSQHIMGHPDSR